MDDTRNRTLEQFYLQRVMLYQYKFVYFNDWLNLQDNTPFHYRNQNCDFQFMTTFRLFERASTVH
jgi:hypothetical protein